MSLIEQLEELRPSDKVKEIFNSYPDRYRLRGMEEMLDDCLEIIEKWLKERNLLNE